MSPNLKFPKDLGSLVAVEATAKDGCADASQPFPPLTACLGQTEAANNNNDEYFQGDIESNAPTIEPPNDSSTQVSSENEESRSKKTRRYIKKLSSIVQQPEELNIDETRLKQVSKDVGKSAYGLQAISVWLVDEDNDHLCPLKGGWWHSPSLGHSEAMIRLTDSNRSDYVPPVPVAPGVDIAGLLWLESNKFERVASMVHRVSSVNQIVTAASHGSLAGLHTERNETLIWRDLKSLVDDPDTAKGPRMALLHEAGIGQATGITFETELHKGMVVFFAEKELNREILDGPANFAFLRQATHYIGGAAAMAEARRALVGHQIQKGLISNSSNETLDSEKQRNSEKKESDNNNTLLDSVTEEIEHSRNCNFPPQRVRVWLQKARGGGLQIPPSLSVRQSLWTALGAFCGLLVLSALNEYYQYLSDGDYALLIGPFGALMTLQYGLTAAPASQPRNAIMGQAVAGAVSLAFTYIPEEILPVWLRRAVGPAIAIATMVKCGFTHPPAGAHAVLYASGQYNFAFYSLVVLSTVISVIPATLVNNMSIKRQYPTYWGFTLPAWIGDLSQRRKNLKGEERQAT